MFRRRFASHDDGRDSMIGCAADYRLRAHYSLIDIDQACAALLQHDNYCRARISLHYSLR